MSKFRKKPVVIEATQWFKNGDHPEDNVYRPFKHTGKVPAEPREGAVVRYFRHPNVNGKRSCDFCDGVMHDHGWIDTLEGGHIVCPGDWVITGVKGERYPCKPDIFAATYESVEEVLKKRPTIEELESILASKEPHSIRLNPDGSITAVKDTLTHIDCVGGETGKVSFPQIQK